MPTPIDTPYVADIHSVLLLAAIYAVAAVFSGLSSFGFSAIVAHTLAGLRGDVPVLLYGRDRQQVVPLAESLADAGLTGVWVVTT